ncbi:HNH homing endonuclease [Acinetobacter phage vB_AbaM_B09_Aci01-1]|uniref:HNH homing endonuclease n=2 Tax=Saclayvirus TaxID=2733128 RepID=A0A386KB13_9CAUD|nr:HNH endonuclease [Acinetobacter phage vB_AbaM_B09_Aci01-1]YP_009813873.1 HNH endonuclease [Acinetobacter phage vB_AbaM_B09_Aci05]AYD82369.1 HNH homing endonuclease [Acinetobacter phage vB_AbaM_B09_Aci05]AYD85580.1 HNH homing endonuclease [Acinetobacter phage vB_AbaM_B09_Aci01-1]
MEEIWKPVVGYEDLFEISSLGRLLSKRSGRILKQHRHPQGYMNVSTRIGGRLGKNVCFKIHRVVAEAFLSNPDSKPTVNHIDGVKHNNILSNLEWATYQENSQHAVDTGLSVPVARVEIRKVEDHGKLLEDFKSGNYTHRELAVKYGVHHTTIGRIVRGERYVL